MFAVGTGDVKSLGNGLSRSWTLVTARAGMSARFMERMICAHSLRLERQSETLICAEKYAACTTNRWATEMDRLNKPCHCGKGTYIETSIYGDLHGELNCSACGFQVKRHDLIINYDYGFDQHWKRSKHEVMQDVEKIAKQSWDACHKFSETEKRININYAKKVLNDIRNAFYPGQNYTPADDLTGLLQQIGNSLSQIEPIAKAQEARLYAENAIRDGNK